MGSPAGVGRTILLNILERQLPVPHELAIAFGSSHQVRASMVEVVAKGGHRGGLGRRVAWPIFRGALVVGAGRPEVDQVAEHGAELLCRVAISGWSGHQTVVWMSTAVMAVAVRQRRPRT